MTGLACWSCGRQIYTVAPLESLFADERRCPRCGAFLHNERRGEERRTGHRRQDAAADPAGPGDDERRVDERRHARRRSPSDGTGRPVTDGELGRTG